MIGKVEIQRIASNFKCSEEDAAAWIDKIIEQAVTHDSKAVFLSVHPFNGITCYVPDCKSDHWGGTCYCQYHFNLWHRNALVECGLCDTCHARSGVRKGNHVKCESCGGW